MAICAMKQEGPRLVCLSVHPHTALVAGAGELVGEGGVEEIGGGIRGC
jgi:hypothetical protein